MKGGANKKKAPERQRTGSGRGLSPSEADQMPREKGPWLRHALLWTAFVAWVVVGVWTVMIPALEDAPEESEEPEESDSAAGVEDDTPE